MDIVLSPVIIHEFRVSQLAIGVDFPTLSGLS